MAKIAFLHPRAGLGREEFGRYWRTVHGPLVATSPGYGLWRRRYTQNHVLGPGPVGDGFAGYGMAVFALPGEASNEGEYSKSTIYRDRVSLDELRFIDMEQTVSMTARSWAPRTGTASAKLVVLSTVAHPIHHPALGAQVDHAARMFLDSASDQLVRGLTVNLIDPESFRRPGAGIAPRQRIDCVHEIWLDESPCPTDEPDLSWDPMLPPEVLVGARSFWAHEFVFFDDGPTKLATGE